MQNLHYKSHNGIAVLSKKDESVKICKQKQDKIKPIIKEVGRAIFWPNARVVIYGGYLGDFGNCDGRGGSGCSAGRYLARAGAWQMSDVAYRW